MAVILFSVSGSWVENQEPELEEEKRDGSEEPKLFLTE
jgi:hypothetical protein